MSFIEDFVEYGSELTDAPLKYYRGGAYFALSTTINGRVRLPMAWSDIKPNVWTLLLGRSTIDRKTTVIEDITVPIIMGLRENEERIISTEFTPEGLLSQLSERQPSRGYLVRDELGGFLSSVSSRSYMDGTYDFLMKLFDGPEYYSRKIRSVSSSFVLRDVYFTMMSGTTYQRMDETVGRTEVLSGFMPRFLILTHHGPRSEGGRNHRTAEDDKRKAALVDQLLQLDRYLRTNPTKMYLDGAAMKRYFEWRDAREEQLIKTDNDVERVVYGRIAAYALKIAMLEQISDALPTFNGNGRGPLNSKFPLKITQDVLERSITFVEDVEQSSLKVYSTLVADKYFKIKESVYGMIERTGEEGIRHRDLLKQSKLRIGQLNEAIETLEMEWRIKDAGQGLSSEPKYKVCEIS